MSNLCKRWHAGPYGFEHLVLTGSLRGSVHYERGGFIATFTDTRFAQIFTDRCTAQIAVERAAAGLLRIAAERLAEKVDIE